MCAFGSHRRNHVQCRLPKVIVDLRSVIETRSRGMVSEPVLPAIALGILSVITGLPSVAHAEIIPSSFRVFDSRASQSAPVASNTTQCFRVAGRNGVPSDAAAVAINLTAVGNVGNGYITAYGSGTIKPSTSTLNFNGNNDTRANNAIVQVGTSDSICLYNEGKTHLILDVMGYFMSSEYAAIRPTRLGDTRSADAGLTTPRAGQTRCFRVNALVPERVPADANGVFLNVAAVQPQTDGFLTVHGKSRARPRNSSTMNFVAGSNGSIGTVAQIGDDKEVCVYVSATTDLIVDLAGFFKSDSAFEMLNKPIRAADTRQFGGLQANHSVCFVVSGRGGVPWGASQVFATVALINPSRQTFAVAYPYQYDVPPTSTVNAPAGENRANGAWLQIGADGKACVGVRDASDIIVDIWGVVQFSGSDDGPSFEIGTLAVRSLSEDTSYCNYQPGSGPQISAGSMDPGQWIYSAQEIGTLPIGGAAKMHYFKLYAHTDFDTRENCHNNRRWIERYHKNGVTACGKVSFPNSFPAGLPARWFYDSGWTRDYPSTEDYRPCPNVF